ncbi:MAG: MliC family protein [Phenylobacterium sp.]
MRRSGVLALAMLIGAGCHDRGSVASPPATPPSVAEGPVNRDPGVTRYRCADGQSVTAGYPDSRTAIVTYKDHAYTLKLVRSGEGARYVGYGLQWQMVGRRAGLSELKDGETAASGPGLACEAPPVSADPDSMIRTAFVPAG